MVLKYILQKSRGFQSNTNNANTSEHGKTAEPYLKDPLLTPLSAIFQGKSMGIQKSRVSKVAFSGYCSMLLSGAHFPVSKSAGC